MSVLTDAIVKVRAALLDNETVKEYCGDNVRPVIANSTDGVPVKDGDYIVIARDGYETSWNKLGEMEETCHMILNATSLDYDRSLALAEAVRLVIRKIYYAEGEDMIEMTDSSEEAVGYEDTGQTRYVQIIRYDYGTIHKG